MKIQQLLKHVLTYKLHDTMKITTMKAEVVDISAKIEKNTLKLNLQKTIDILKGHVIGNSLSLKT